MRYQKMKKCGVEVSAITVGTWAIGGKNSAGGGYGDVVEEDSIKAIQTMIENGVNLIDTAPIYGEGNAEVVVGKAIQGMRDKVMIATKFGSYISHYDGKAVRNNKYDHIMREVEESLERLNTDYIDFYLMHWPDVHTPIAETMAAMNKLKESGKIRYCGLCNADKDLIKEAMQYGELDFVQVPFSMVNQKDRELMKWLQKHNIDTMTWGSLGSGILTGKIRNKPNFDEKDFRNTFYPFYKEPMFSKIMEFLKTMDKVSEKYKQPLSQIALNWSTQKDYVTTALVGVRNEQEALENCKTFEWQLSEEDVYMLDKELERLGIGEAIS